MLLKLDFHKISMETPILDLSKISLMGMDDAGTQQYENKTAYDIINSVPTFSENSVFVGHKNSSMPKLAGKYKAIVSDKTGECVSIRTNEYALVQHRDVLKSVFESMNATGFKVDMVKPNYVGGKMFTTILLKDHEINVNGNDKIKTGIHVINSVDGSTGVVICPATFRLFCRNQFHHSDFINAVIKWHIGNPKILMTKIREAISTAVGSVEQIKRSYESWTTENFNIRELKEEPYFSVVKSMPQKYIKAIVENKPSTRWELFNVLTALNTHDEHRNAQAQYNFDEKIEKLMAIRV